MVGERCNHDFMVGERCGHDFMVHQFFVMHHWYWSDKSMLSQMSSMGLCASRDLVMSTVVTTTASIFEVPTAVLLSLGLLVGVAVRQILVVWRLEWLVTEEGCLASLVIRVMALQLFCMGVMLMPVVVLVLLDEHVVVLVLLSHFLAFSDSMLVSWLGTDWFNLCRSIVLTLVKLLRHVWLHL